MLATPFRHGVKAETNFHYGDRGDPDGWGRLRVQPFDDGLFGLLAHERGDDVGIENDHASKSGGSISKSRKSGISSPGLRPERRKSWAISVPRRLPPRPSCFVASRRISRTSSSTLRPWRVARRRSLSFTSCSSLRTMSCAMIDMISRYHNEWTENQVSAISLGRMTLRFDPRARPRIWGRVRRGGRRGERQKPRRKPGVWGTRPRDGLKARPYIIRSGA